jgi:hypothetical protein
VIGRQPREHRNLDSAERSVINLDYAAVKEETTELPWSSFPSCGGPNSVWDGSLRMIDYEHFDGAFGGLELQPELVHCGEDK